MVNSADDHGTVVSSHEKSLHTTGARKWQSSARSHPRSQTARHRRKGSVLVAVLAIILLLSFMVTRFMEQAVEDLEYRALFNEPADLNSFAYSMLEASLATIQEVALIDDGKLYAPEQGWSDPLTYTGIPIPNGWEVQVTITDEGGRLPLNTMSEELLNRLLEEALDLDFGVTRELSSCLLDWIDSDESSRLNGAESEDYLDRDPAYRAANGPLQSLEELRYIQVWEDEFFDERGRPNELYAQLSNLVSVVNTGPINLNAAPSEVIEVLALVDGFQEESLFDGADEPYLIDAPESVNSQHAGTEVGLMRVTVSVSRGDIPFVVSALVEPNISDEESTQATGTAQSAESDGVKTGATSEQDAINYPFKLLLVSEYSQELPTSRPARYSAMDIGEEADSF